VTDPSLQQVQTALADVRRRIASAGGHPARVEVVGVTKGFGPDAVAAAVSAGLVDIGENYAQELLTKAATVESGVESEVRWHFLGPVQRNKVAALAPHVHLWQAVDRVAAGEAIAKRQSGARVLVQVNVSGEASKAGVAPSATADLVGALRGLDLDVAGLMTVGPRGPREDARAGFRLLAAMAGDLGLQQLSMGMSEDLEIAVEEGATMVRIGRALFGPRLGSPRLRR
jgi:pyridoxal phosphate enzyme (YggS family)